MDSYETLLENYNTEEKYANDSFSNMMACFESLNIFANEDVNFEVTISLEEALSGDIKDTTNKIKEAAKRTAAALKKRVSEFITKIKDALSRFITKAKITIADKGSKALKKMLGNSELVIGKDIMLKTFKDNKSNAAIFDQVTDAIDEIHNIFFYYYDEEKELDDTKLNDVKSIVDVLGDNVAKSNIVESTILRADENMKVKDAVTKYVDPLLKDTTDNLNNAQKTVNKVINRIKRDIRTYEWILTKDEGDVYDEENKAKYNKSINREREMISLLMKISTRYINYVSTVLIMCASNASKIALAAVNAKFSKKEKEATN